MATQLIVREKTGKALPGLGKKKKSRYEQAQETFLYKAYVGRKVKEDNESFR